MLQCKKVKTFCDGLQLGQISLVVDTGLMQFHIVLIGRKYEIQSALSVTCFQNNVKVIYFLLNL